jgi:hypothetical protein
MLIRFQLIGHVVSLERSLPLVTSANIDGVLQIESAVQCYDTISTEWISATIKTDKITYWPRKRFKGTPSIRTHSFRSRIAGQSLSQIDDTISNELTSATISTTDKITFTSHEVIEKGVVESISFLCQVAFKSVGSVGIIDHVEDIDVEVPPMCSPGEQIHQYLER